MEMKGGMATRTVGPNVALLIALVAALVSERMRGFMEFTSQLLFNLVSLGNKAIFLFQLELGDATEVGSVSVVVCVLLVLSLNVTSLTNDFLLLVVCDEEAVVRCDRNVSPLSELTKVLFELARLRTEDGGPRVIDGGVERGLGDGLCGMP